MSFQDLSTIQCIIEDIFWTQSVKLIPFCIFSCFHRYKGWSHTVCVTLKTLLVHLLLVSSEYILEFKMYLLICIWSSHLKLSPRFCEVEILGICLFKERWSLWKEVMSIIQTGAAVKRALLLLWNKRQYEFKIRKVLSACVGLW